MSTPEERRACADARVDADRRGQWLVRLLAPLVHRLNNSLAVVQGVYELGNAAGAAEHELARRELAVLAQVLARLGRLARTDAARPERVTVAEILRTHELLLGPLAAGRAVALELCSDGAGSVELDGRFEPLLLAASCALLTASAGAKPARLRLTARATPAGLVLGLGARGAAHAGAESEALAGLARELGGRQRVRATPGACCVRLSLALPAGASVPAAGPAVRRARRLLLLHAADAERELVAALLREHGWLVSVSESVPRAGLFEVALVEQRLAREDPALLSAVRARFGLGRVEVLERRMRPGAVLGLLGGL